MYLGTFVLFVWMIVCLTVYARLDGNIDEESWHWKLYSNLAFNAKSPRTECRYVLSLFRILVVNGTLFAILFCLALALASIGTTLCLLKDWVVYPLLFSERVTNWRDKQYWKDITGIGHSEKGTWRPFPRLVAFSDYSVAHLLSSAKFWSAVFTGVMVYEGFHFGSNTSLNELGSSLSQNGIIVFDTVLVGGLLYMIVVYRQEIKILWKKFKEKHCRLVISPLDEKVCNVSFDDE